MLNDNPSHDRKSPSTSLYRIVVDGELHESWSDWLGEVILERNTLGSICSHTILLSEIPDQAALRGLLNRIWDLNLTLISVNRQERIERGENDEN